MVLRRGVTTRRVPYAFFVTRPGLHGVTARQLRRVQEGSTRTGQSFADLYRFPAAPFGHSPDYGIGPDMQEDGGERLYSIRVRNRVVNIGAAVISSSPGAAIDPFFLGAKDENAVQGYVGTPTNINGLTIGYRLPVGAAGAVFAPPGTYYVSVDSGRDVFTDARLAGTYRLRSWVNDVNAPLIRLLTTRVSAGRPTIAIQTLDRGAGVDPFSLVLSYGRVLVGAAAYDPFSGIALFPLDRGAEHARRPAARDVPVRRLPGGEERGRLRPRPDAEHPGPRHTHAGRLRPDAHLADAAPAYLRRAHGAAARRRRPGRHRPHRAFFDGKRQIRVLRRNTAGLYATTWQSRGAKRGLHTLRAVVQIGGKRVEATRVVRVCR